MHGVDRGLGGHVIPFQHALDMSVNEWRTTVARSLQLSLAIPSVP